jgi:hypothetical protein
MMKIVILISVLLMLFQRAAQPVFALSWWPVQSIDTMKYSRDLSASKKDDPTFDSFIDQHLADIAATGATHVAIATPYDAQFVPMLKRWVLFARRHDLKVWFRGNFSGWEGWFGVSRITREEHKKLLQEFLKKNPDLFEDGDIFTACPECENGGPGDPRQTGDTEGFRQFLRDERQIAVAAFSASNKQVDVNVFSMNGDVARLIMNPVTTKQLGGRVTVDHYVKTPDQLVKDLNDFAAQSQGKVLLGEYGAPIPDIHGHFTEEQQAQWISDSLEKLATLPNMDGLNYWVGLGGSTSLWREAGKPNTGVAVLKSYFQPSVAAGKVVDQFGQPLEKVHIDSVAKQTVSDSRGSYEIPYLSQLPETGRFLFTKAGYEAQTVHVDLHSTNSTIRMKKIDLNLWEKIQIWFFNHWNRIFS